MLKILLLSLSRQYTVYGQYIPSLFIEPEVRHDKTSYKMSSVLYNTCILLTLYLSKYISYPLWGLSFIVSFTWHYKFRLAIHFHPNIGYLPAKIKICYHSSAEESAKNQDTIPLFRRRVSKKSKILFRRRVSIKSRYATTLPQKSQQKIKIRFHSSAEESVKSQDTLPLFRRRVSKSQDTLPLFRRRVSLSSRGLTHIPPKNIYFMGLTHTPPI